jgi:MoaA/NifB/PqqE/SkfB family radical SAM enzyme
MRCAHCGYACTKKGKDMSLKIWRAALELNSQYDSTVSIGGGEPTLHPDFPTIFFEAIADAEEGAWLATNGSQTKTALLLARLAKKGVVGVTLSQDEYHDPIDDEVVAAFHTDRSRDPLYSGYNDLREIRDVTGREIKAGRCKRGSNECLCPGLFITPEGIVRACGCKDAPAFGDVFKGITLPDEWDMGDCYRSEGNCKVAMNSLMKGAS